MLAFFGGNKQGADKHRLGSTYLFAGLDTRQLKTVDHFLHTRRYLTGEVVFDQGEEGQALYVILSGRIAICTAGGFASPIAVLGEGNFFGELALLDDSPRSAQARAIEDAEIAVLFRGDFERLMQLQAVIASHIALQLARHLGQRLRRMIADTPPKAT